MIDRRMSFRHKKEIPDIRESLSELRAHLRRERGARRWTRLQVLYLLKSDQAHLM